MQQTDLSRARARTLRQTMTPAERKLWHALGNRRFMGLKVRRQVSIGTYIADFYCAEHRLVIEADGGGQGRGRDAARDRFLAANGLRTLRLWNSDILCNLSGALDLIAIAAQPIDPRRPI
jgi:very-short-patch-repair endonuclease